MLHLCSSLGSTGCGCVGSSKKHNHWIDAPNFRMIFFGSVLSRKRLKPPNSMRPFNLHGHLCIRTRKHTWNDLCECNVPVDACSMCLYIIMMISSVTTTASFMRNPAPVGSLFPCWTSSVHHLDQQCSTAVPSWRVPGRVSQQEVNSGGEFLGISCFSEIMSRVKKVVHRSQ